MRKGVLNHIFQLTTVTLLGVILTACGGGGGGGNGGLFGDGTAIAVQEELRMGYIADDGYQDGLLGISDGSLSLGESAVVTLDFVDTDSARVDTEVAVTFTSICVELGTASLSDTEINSVAGQAIATYTLDEGCSGDTITASASVDTKNFTAVGFITVPQDPVNSVRFVAATPPEVSIAGSGGVETSEVSFVVLDGDGNPVPDRLVTFSLDNAPGGATLSTNSDTTDENGEVKTIARSGTAITTLVVTAAVSGTDESTTSQGIAVSTGLPDEVHFGIAVEFHNVEAWEFSGETSAVTVRLSDIFGNPVPDGTKISFTTEGGTITPSCLTTTGACSVEWTGTEPRSDLVSGDTGVSDILAVAIGNESFVDENGNGLFDDGEQFTDLGEPYRDDNNSESYDIGEYFFDHDNDGLRDDPDGKYNGVLCNAEASDCDKSAVAISANTRIVMSSIDTEIVGVDCSNSGVAVALPTTITGSVTFCFLLSDENGNALPFGTELKAESSVGEILGGDSFKVFSTTSASWLGFSINMADVTESDSGLFTLEATFSGDRTWTVLSIPISVVVADPAAAP